MVVLVVGLLGVSGLLLTAAPASAHAQFTSSDPAEGAQLDQLPAVVVMTYSEDVAPQFVQTAVITPDGTTVPTQAAADGSTVSVDLGAPDVAAAAGQAGTWSVVARVVSVDGHPVEHTTTFVLAPAAEAAGPSQETPPAASLVPSVGTADPSTPADVTTAVEPSDAGPATQSAPAATPVSGEPTTAVVDGLPRWAVVVGAAALVLAAAAALLVQLRRRPPGE